jgi:hypothetical protein
LTTANVRATIARATLVPWSSGNFGYYVLNLKQNRERSCWDRTISETSAAALDEDSDALISVKRLKIVNIIAARRSLPKSDVRSFCQNRIRSFAD